MQLLEPRYRPADVKSLRKKRRTFYTKVELLIGLISAIELGPLSADVTEPELRSKMEKLNKIENDEYLATLKQLAATKKTTAKPSSKVKLIETETEAVNLVKAERPQSITLT